MNVIEKLAKKMGGDKHYVKGFVWDSFIIGILAFVMVVIFILFVVIWGKLSTTLKPQIATLNATEQNQVLGLGNGFFNDSLDIILIFIYFILILASFMAAAYEGASGTATLILGIVFLIVAVIVSMGISDIAHQYLTQAALLPSTKQHFSMALYLMDNLPLLTGIFTVGYLVFVITRKEIVVRQGGGGNYVGG